MEIADAFYLQAPAIHPPQQLIFRVDPARGFVVGTGLPIGGGRHNEAVQLLQRPAGFDEPHRQVVEQFRMSWWIAPEAEIARRAD